MKNKSNQYNKYPTRSRAAYPPPRLGVNLFFIVVGVLEAWTGRLGDQTGCRRGWIGRLGGRTGRLGGQTRRLGGWIGRLGAHQNRIQIANRLETKNQYFCNSISMIFAFPGHTELFPRDTKLFPTQNCFPGTQICSPGPQICSLGTQHGRTDSAGGSQNHFLAGRIDSRGSQTVLEAPRSSQKLVKSISRRF